MDLRGIHRSGKSNTRFMTPETGTTTSELPVKDILTEFYQSTLVRNKPKSNWSTPLITETPDQPKGRFYIDLSFDKNC